MVSERSPARAFLVTVLDAALIIAVSAAVVTQLGGRARLDVGGIRITLRTATNFLVFAGVFGGIRAWLGRGLRPLPALPRPDEASLDLERERFAVPMRPTRTVRLYAAAALLGSLVWIVPHIRHIHMVTDPGDPLFSAWRLARLAHQLVTDPRHLFDGNQFYPRPLTLTYSDATFLQGLLAAPFVLAGIDPLVAANALTIVAFPACGLAFYFAAWRLTGDPRAALVAAMVGAWYPFHAEHYPHLELHWVMFVPLAIVAALRMLAAPRWTTGLALGGAIAAQWLASMYVGVMLVSFLLPFMAVVALGWRVRFSWRLATAILAAGAIAGPAVAGLALPYMTSRQARGDRAPHEVSDGSARPSDYGAAHVRLVTYQWRSGEGHRAERELFPGATTLALAAAGMAPPLGAIGIATIVSGALTFDWSLGFKGLTYDDLYKRSVIHRGMRVPARFSMLVGTALVLLSAFGARRILHLGGTPPARAAICGALTLLVLWDLRLDPRLQTYPATRPSIYDRVTPEMVLAEFPRFHDIDYMYFSTRHWAHLLGGYSGFIPVDARLEAALRAFPTPDGIGQLRALGATHVTYNCALEEKQGRCAAVFEALDGNPALELVAGERWERADVRLYRFR
jgi:hypothetical protein